MSEIIFDGVSKTFAGDSHALRELELEVRDGEFLIMVGPSGCGKTTALRCVAGLEKPSSGRIVIGDRVVTDVHPRERDVAMVFQSYALYTHMSVGDNIGFPLRLRKRPKDEIRKAVGEVAGTLGLEGVLDRQPRTLSGGQRQRVAMGRALVRRPKAFLMDEPLSNLDAKLRVEMRSELALMHRELGATFLYVTHDQQEALTMGDRVAVLQSGRLQQVASPRELYDRPANIFVAAFIGSPAMNLLPARLEREDGVILSLGDQAVRLGSAADQWQDLDAYAGRDVVLGIRPEDFELEGGASLNGTVDLVEWSGSELQVRAHLDARSFDLERWLVTREDGDSNGETDSAVLEEIMGGGRFMHRSDQASVSALLEPRADVAENQQLALAFDPRRLHLFDPDSGEALVRRAE